MATYNQFENDQAYDLVNTELRWAHYDDYYWENEAKPHPRNYNEELDAQGPYMVHKVTSRAVHYFPLREIDSPTKESPVLFKLFSDMDATPESYLNFACKYGHLNEPLYLWFKDIPDNVLHGESLYFWRRHQWLMRYSLQLWDWIKGDNLEKLSSCIKWDQNLPYTFSFQIGSEEDINSFLSKDHNWSKSPYIIGNANLYFCHEEQQDRFVLNSNLTGLYELKDVLKIGDVRLPAIKALQLIINSQLREYPSSYMLTLNGKKQDYVNQLIPGSILASMWLQLSQYIAGEKRIKQCPICRQWSDVTNVKGSWIKHRECANWDRVTKKRKFENAKKLLSENKSLEDVSQFLNLEKHHIERWLSE